MILPTVQGKIDQKDFFIFTACDTVYFDDFGKILINSVLKNTTVGIHIHVFNPREDQIQFCKKDSRISLSYESAPIELFVAAAERYRIEPSSEPEKTRYLRTKTAMDKGRDKTLVERMQKTYFACARFVSLAKLIKDSDRFFAIDVDAVVRKEIPRLSAEKNCYLHKITGKKSRILAGGLYFLGNPKGYRFIKEYSRALADNLENDCIYWSLDQDLLDGIVPKYDIGNLPGSLIDWEMRLESVVWTAKGLRKDLPVFIAEQSKYNS